MKYYHATKQRLQPGDVLSPHKCKSAEVGGFFGVYVTTSPAPHYTIADRACKEGWFVYEVIPNGKIILGNWDDIVCPNGATVIRRVGNARGLARQTTLPKPDPCTCEAEGNTCFHTHAQQFERKVSMVRTKKILTPRGWREKLKGI